MSVTWPTNLENFWIAQTKGNSLSRFCLKQQWLGSAIPKPLQNLGVADLWVMSETRIGQMSESAARVALQGAVRNLLEEVLGI